MRNFAVGFIVALAIVAIATVMALETGAVPARQDVPPGRLEKWAANTSLRATIQREMPRAPYPYSPPSDADFVNGAVLYVQNCAVC
ncbi:MAG: hypothetical protein JOZ24_06595, partial [Candidatus Eremiobacteraeota bacterium]|nr:hypothetical protein [Candidatus Eremiobacteraeota bacterium]